MLCMWSILTTINDIRLPPLQKKFFNDMDKTHSEQIWNHFEHKTWGANPRLKNYTLLELYLIEKNSWELKSIKNWKVSIFFMFLEEKSSIGIILKNFH